MGCFATCSEGVRASRRASPPAPTLGTAVQRVSAATRLPPSRVPPNAGGVAQTAFPGLAVIGKGGGQPLSPRVRADMANRLGADFSDVRVHTDAAAARSAEAIGARAYTVGSEVVFGHGCFAPDSHEGLRTLAHELTHVRQQRKGPVPGTDTGGGVAISDPSDSFEREARATAARVTFPQPVTDAQHPGEKVVSRPTSAHRVTVQRDDRNGDAGGGKKSPAADVTAAGQAEPKASPAAATGSPVKCKVDNFWMEFKSWDISWPNFLSGTTTIRLPVHFRLDLAAGCTKADCVIGQLKKGRTSGIAPMFEEFPGWTSDGELGHPQWWDGSTWYGGDGSWDWFGKDGADFYDRPGFNSVGHEYYPLYWGGAGRTGSFKFETYVADKATGVVVDRINWEVLIDYSAPNTGTHSHG
jgi:hypothetical protein